MLNKTKNSDTQKILQTLQKIPSNDLQADINFLNEHLMTQLINFDDFFNVLPKLKLENLTTDQKNELISNYIKAAPNSSAIFQLYEFSRNKFLIDELYSLFSNSYFFPDLIIKEYSRSSENLPSFLNAYSKIHFFESYLRYARQTVFRFCFLRQELDNCLSIIFSLNPSRSDQDFLEFSTYCTTITPLLCEDQESAKKLFDYIMNLAVIFDNAMRDWFINFASSFAPLLKMHSVHQSVLDFVTFLKKPQSTIKRFESATSGLFSNDTSLSDAPSMLRPYSLYKEWFVDITELDQSKSKEDCYNALLYLCKNDDSTAVKVLDQLPTKVSLPFYVQICDKQPEAFHSAIERAFNNKDIDMFLAILEKTARINPALVKPHFKSISKVGFERAQLLVSLLIKADLINFEKLWDHIKSTPILNIKDLFREGILQIQRRPQTNTNKSFILTALKTYFVDINGQINWHKVAEMYPSDFDIASTMLLSNTKDEESSNSSTQVLLKWQQQFLNFVITKCPSSIQMASVIPYLLVVSGKQKIEVNDVHWVLRFLPASLCDSEAVIEACAIIEIVRSILINIHSKEEALKTIQKMFDINYNSITNYASIYAHAALCLELHIEQSLKTIIDNLKATSLIISRACRIAVKILQSYGYTQVNEIAETIDMPIVGKILSYMNPTSIKPTNYQPSSHSDIKILEILQNTNSLVAQDIEEEVNKSEFESLESIKIHFLKLALSCYLLLPARSATKTTFDQMIGLLKSPNSSIVQKEFSILALSQLQTQPEENYLQIYKDTNDSLGNPLMQLAVRNNDSVMITKLLELSNDFTTILPLKPLIVFTDAQLIQSFLQRTIEHADVDTLISNISIFSVPLHIITILDELRKRDLYEPYRLNITDRLKNALLRLSPEELDGVYNRFDDLALVCASELSAQPSTVIWKVIETQTSISLPILIQFVLKKRNSLSSYIEAIFPILQNTTSQQSADKCVELMTLLLLFKENNQPYITIQNRLECNPNEMSEEELLLLLPSLVCNNKNIGSEQVAVFQSVQFNKYQAIVDEIKEVTNLKNYEQSK